LFSAPALAGILLVILSSCGPASVPGSIDFGELSSPVRVELFTDYQCPVCTRFHDEVETALIREVVENRGYLFRVTPVALLGPESALAGAYALAARDQGRFEDYAAVLYGAQREINSGVYTAANLRSMAAGIGLDTQAMERAIGRGDYQSVMARNTSTARALGVSGPPSFAVVYTVGGERRYELIKGYVSLAVFIDFLDQVEIVMNQ
jgi:predicted DsbA family dithiol-disulfide isomerase